MSIPNSNVYVPPPPPPDPSSATKDSLEKNGIMLKIATDAVVAISHTFIEKEGDPTKHCLIVIDVNKKGEMRFEWADPEMIAEDTRLTNMNRRLDNGKVIIISADAVMFDGSAGESAAREFWNKNGMTAIEKFKYAPDQEYYSAEITGKPINIQIIKGWAKIIG